MYFFDDTKFCNKTGSCSADIKYFCPGGKGCVPPPLVPHLRTKGMGKCETEPLITLRIIKIVWEYSRWEYTG